MSDFISRQSLIDALNKFAPEHYTALVNSIIMKEPSAVPTCNKTEQVEDCISRQAAIDYLMTNMAWYNEDGYEESEDEKLSAITDLINGVPSAEPDYDLGGYSTRLWKAAYERGKAEPERKKGKWQITNAYPHNIYCSECHKKFGQTHWAVWEDGSLPRNFCPHCGAMMEGESNE